MAGIDYRGFEATDDTVIWRYMATPRLIDLLSGALYFAPAEAFNDEFEGAISTPEQVRRLTTLTSVSQEASQDLVSAISRSFQDLRRLTKINCWHAATHENIAMWERYRADAVIVSTVGRLKRSLREFRLKSTFAEEKIVVGCVHYLDYSVDSMRDRTMLGVFLQKRLEYRDENEIRALLPLRQAEEFGVVVPHAGVKVEVDLRELIAEIRIRKVEHEAEIRAAAEREGLAGTLRLSTLTNRPTY